LPPKDLGLFGSWALTNCLTVVACDCSMGVAMEETRLVTTSLEGFIQQVAVACIGKGYFYYVTGRVPEGKDPRSIDRKLAERYGATLSKWSRYRRKRGGHANVRYLRHERFFVLFATDGVSPFFHHEAGLIRDCRREPFKYGGYSLSSKAGRVCVRIEREQYNVLKAVFLELALRRSPERLERMISNLPFEPYAPVRRQLLGLVRSVNAVRKAAGLAPLPYECVRMKRRIVRPFAGTDDSAEGSRGESETGETPVEVQPDLARATASRAAL
jgi:hypothetical protein